METEIKPLTLSILAVTLAEAGSAMVMLNASPHAPLGFWLWFDGITVLSPLVGYRLYRRVMQRGAH